MKNLLSLGIILTVMTGCAVLKTPGPELMSTATPQVGLPNPASVYCTQNGNKHEIHTAADGSQSGVCVFPDGSTCNEWAYFRGDCGSATQISPTPTTIIEASGGYKQPGTSEEIADWWGVIKSTNADVQYDDYFERQYLGGSIYFGIDSTEPSVREQIEVLRDSGKIVHLYGTLLSNVPDFNGSQIQVDRIEIFE